MVIPGPCGLWPVDWAAPFFFFFFFFFCLDHVTKSHVIIGRLQNRLMTQCHSDSVMEAGLLQAQFIL